MERAAGADIGGGTERGTVTETAPSRAEVVVTAAAGMGFICAVAAAIAAWMLMTDPDRLMWAAALVGR